MRILKFRAWDELEKKFLWPWPEGFSILGEVTCFDLIGQQLKSHDRKNSLERMNDIRIIQYTGLHDKNGKEIYEGDILSGIDPNGDRIDNFIVEWDNKYVGYLFEYSYGDWDLISLGTEGFEFEITGDKFQNPELLST